MPTRDELLEDFRRYHAYFQRQRVETGTPSIFEAWWAGNINGILQLNAEELEPAVTEWLKDPAMRQLYSKEAVWKRIVDEIASCRNCELASHRTKTVPGNGSLRAELMLVGEAPGANEDASGEPFVGQAGDALDQDYLHTSMGLSRAQVIVVNTLKCRPPQNRDPKPEELLACQHFLHRQIMAVNPKAILCLGKVAGAQVTGQPIATLKEVLGQVYWYQHIPVMVTVHPAGYIRSKDKWKDHVWSTTQWIKGILQQPYDGEFWNRQEGNDEVHRNK